jgi:hypothetical protein
LQTAAVRDVLEERRFHDVMGETTTATSGRRPRSKLKMTISSTRPQRQSVRQRLPASGGERQHLEGDALDADTLMMMAGLVYALGRAQFGKQLQDLLFFQTREVEAQRRTSGAMAVPHGAWAPGRAGGGFPRRWRD